MNSLEKVYFCITQSESYFTDEYVGLLQRFYNVKFLTLNSELVESLSLNLKSVSLKFSPFANLRSIKIYPAKVSEKAEEGEKPLTIASELKSYLLDSSPSATFTIVSREEVRGYRNAVSAQNLMEKLWAMLEKEKANSETNMTQLDHKKETMESHEEENHEHGNAQVDDQRAPVEKLQMHIQGKMANIKSCWEDLGVQIDQGRKKACHIISKLRDIEVLLLSELPASKRDKLQACFSILCAEVDIAVKKIMDGMKSQCDIVKSI
uniref:uncharacterized protein LOC122580019 n=1 Tax=Erigeron canadensis TaxID=72917 RepID=UPI001CB8981D|nr:uncharacterized protein LOC122580019 [Erigeron canadensis]